MKELHGPFLEDLEKYQKLKNSRRAAVDFFKLSSDRVVLGQIIDLARNDEDYLHEVIGHLDAFCGIPVSELDDYGLGGELFGICEEVVDYLDVAFGFSNNKSAEQLLQPEL